MAYKNDRPDPDELLKAITAEEEKSRRGKLRIFFGGSAGVGKTYAMLNAAHQLKKEGVDVMVGLVETHGRPETKNLVENLPIIECREINHRGILLKEFDIDTALKRKPAIILLDELAHSNVPGSRHPKRWMDVEELLDAGISVYTTLNVQHLESVNDIVAGITGVWVKETVPDPIFDKADDITLIDIPSDELLKRLSEGKVYIAEQAKDRAAQNFFKKSNLIALRELALRRTAERVDEQMAAYNTQTGVKGAGVAPAEKIMVCIGPDPLSVKLVRTAKRLATGIKSPWMVVYVENQRHYKLNKKSQASIERIMRLATSMGANTDIIQGQNAREELINYARKNNYTKIVVGKASRSRFKDFIKGSLADELIRRSGNIDVYVVTGDPAPKGELLEKTGLKNADGFSDYLIAGLTPTLCVLTGELLKATLNQVNLAMIFVFGIVLASTRIGRYPAMLCASLCALSFNFFFVEPLYRFGPEDAEFLVTLCALTLTAIIICSKTNLLSLQLKFSRERERNTGFLFALTRELAATRGHKNMAEVAARHIGAAFDGAAVIWLAEENGNLRILNESFKIILDAKDEGAAKWCFEHRQPAGKGSNTLPSAKGVYLPLTGSDGAVGVMGVIPHQEDREYGAGQMELMEGFANLLAASFERAYTADSAEKSRIATETERLRNRLLSSVSDDLKTPVASIRAAIGKLFEGIEKLQVGVEIKIFLKILSDEASRLSRIVASIQDMSSFGSDKLKLNLSAFFMEEVIGSALVRCEKRLLDYEIITQIEEGLPLVNIDGLLIEQVIIGFLENAAHRSRKNSSITVSAKQNGDEVVFGVTDTGKKVEVMEVEAALSGKSTTDVAVSSEYAFLAVSKGIIEAHGGRAWIENLYDNKGSRFCFAIKAKPVENRQMPPLAEADMSVSNVANMGGL